MRDKVVLIRGWNRLSEAITLAAFERINADHVVVISALRRPQLLPPDFRMDLGSIELKVVQLLNHWRHIEQEHMVAAEYAQIVVDQGKTDVKAVEGDSLTVPWFYETVRTFHKHLGQSITEAEVDYTHKDGIRIRMGGMIYSRDEAIKRLKPEDWLG